MRKSLGVMGVILVTIVLSVATAVAQDEPPFLDDDTLVPYAASLPTASPAGRD